MFSAPAMLGIAGLMSQKSVGAAAKLGIAVIPPNTTETKLGREAMKKLAACNLKAPCLAPLLQPLGTARALVGSLDRDDVHYIVTLSLVDVAQGTVVATGTRRVLIASRQLDAEYDAMLPDVLAGKTQAPGTLSVSSNARHARVFVDERPMGEVPLSTDLPPGKHVVRLEKQLYLPIERYVELKSGETAQADFKLQLMPNQVDPDAAVAVDPNAVSAHTDVPSGPMPRIAGLPAPAFVAAAATVVFAGVGTGFGLASRSYAGKAKDTDGDGAINLGYTDLKTGKTDATVANVFFIGAGVAAAATVAFYFIFDDKPAATAGVTVLPQGGAVATVQGSF
jgi:hypothetical protein